MTEEKGVEPGLLDSREIHRGRVVHLSIDRVRFPDGSVGELELIRHKGAAAILPVVGRVEEADPEILLIRQYRYAAGGYVYEVPAGIRDPKDESWEACARRELEEETGMRAGKLTPLTWIFTTPGFTNEVIHLFLASELTAGSVKYDVDEFMELVRVPLSKALEWVGEGQITDAKTLVTLLFAARYALSAPPGARVIDESG
jgi:ADP-ribose pyrophosphatase